MIRIFVDGLKKIYLDNSPEFQNFFNINKDKEVYGRINFIHDINELNMTPCYIFVSSGENNAEIFKNAQDLKNKFPDCSINFLQKGDAPEEIKNFNGLNPVYGDEDFQDDEIERMAFNYHLIWEKGWSASHEKALENFREAYNRNSSVCSVKYKLFSLGINLLRA